MRPTTFQELENRFSHYDAMRDEAIAHMFNEKDDRISKLESDLKLQEEKYEYLLFNFYRLAVTLEPPALVEHGRRIGRSIAMPLILTTLARVAPECLPWNKIPPFEEFDKEKQIEYRKRFEELARRENILTEDMLEYSEKDGIVSLKSVRSDHVVMGEVD
jgi:hypothetical protein